MQLSGHRISYNDGDLIQRGFAFLATLKMFLLEGLHTSPEFDSIPKFKIQHMSGYPLLCVLEVDELIILVVSK